MLALRLGLGLQAVQYHFLEVLILVWLYRVFVLECLVLVLTASAWLYVFYLQVDTCYLLTWSLISDCSFYPRSTFIHSSDQTWRQTVV